ncbi:hypothetical protein KQX54_016433 [Cotesia glomerata]|uniref:Uncharacterized protein n=1 Tax=Cotesia glomerata TaxID=32391 RepID=A0AAV7HRZ4_COTGL|nr:hypothetical protein KQX54_016433 [Cotesia glomerata]
MWQKDQFFGFYIFVVVIFCIEFKSADSQNTNTESSGTHNTITNDLSERTNMRCREGFYLARELCYRFPKTREVFPSLIETEFYFTDSDDARLDDILVDYVLSGPRGVTLKIKCIDHNISDENLECSLNLPVIEFVNSSSLEDISPVAGEEHYEVPAKKQKLKSHAQATVLTKEKLQKIILNSPNEPYKLVNHRRACDHLANTTYANRMCVCLENYYLDDNHCYKIPLGPNDPVDSAKGCTYLIGTFFDGGHCKTNRSITFETVEDYEPPMYDHFDNFSCPPEFFQYNNFCYGFLDANCSAPSDCLSTSYSCQSGTCKKVDSQIGKSTLSLEPGVSAYWTDDEEIYVSRGFHISASRALSCSSYFLRLTLSFAQKLFPQNFASCYVTRGLTSTNSKFTQMLIAPSAEWAAPPYPFDRAIYGGHSGVDQPIFICRTTISNFQHSGILLPPYYDICYYNAYTLSSNSTQFEVLVEKEISTTTSVPIIYPS